VSAEFDLKAEYNEDEQDDERFWVGMKSPWEDPHQSSSRTDNANVIENVETSFEYFITYIYYYHTESWASLWETSSIL